MKKTILICIIINLLTFVACNRNVGNRAVTEAEKRQASEEMLINRLQTTIELFEEVNKAVITIDSSDESEKTVDVLIITESDTQITDEQKSGIINIIKNSVNGTVAVDIKEEQHTD